jgi:ElaA protein
VIHVARFDELGAAILYALLKLRVDVFVVEQRCPYQEIDGRDTEPGTRHLWATGADAAAPLAYVRTLAEPDGTTRIGRVATAREARGRGLARELVMAALDLSPGVTHVLDAQKYLVGFYEGLGFAPSGPEYVDDGIPHVPMRRRAAA